METIDFKKVVQESLQAAKAELGKSRKNFKPYAGHEFRQFTENAEFLARLRKGETIDDEELALRLEIQRIALKNVLLTIKGIGLLTAQKTVNAVVNIVNNAVLKALTIALPM